MKVLSWPDMYLRPDQSRTIVIIRCKYMNTTPSYVTKPPPNPSDFTNYIPSIPSVLVKFLGQIINRSLTDQNSIDEFQQKLIIGLSTIYELIYKDT